MIVTRELDWKDWGDIDERTQNFTYSESNFKRSDCIS